MSLEHSPSKPILPLSAIWIAASLLCGCGGSPDNEGISDAGSEDGGSDSGVDTDLYLEPGFEELFEYESGCADVTIYTYGDYGPGITYPQQPSEVVLEFGYQGALEQMWALDEYTLTKVFTFPTQEEAHLDIRWGESLSFGICNDSLDGDPVTRKTYLPTSGTVTLQVHRLNSDPWDDMTGNEASADLTLENMIFELEGDPSVDPVPLDYLELTDINVGWYPGW